MGEGLEFLVAGEGFWVQGLGVKPQRHYAKGHRGSMGGRSCIEGGLKALATNTLRAAVTP